jgi:hypothetical protein
MPEAYLGSPFYLALEPALANRGIALNELCPDGDVVARRVLHDYGAMHVASDAVLPPPVCVFTREDGVARFQTEAGWTATNIFDATIELQPAAMAALVRAREAAHGEDLDITPRDGAEGSRRNYADTVRLWNSRFFPALDHWQKVGRLSQDQVNRLQALPINQQVAEVLELEKQGIFFSKDLSKSILYSIAAPGTSQHIAMFAFDVNEFLDARVRAILAAEGWFQTVLSDLPHFTYLGLDESDLPQRGLKAVEVNSQQFWIPDVC